LFSCVLFSWCQFGAGAHHRLCSSMVCGLSVLVQVGVVYSDCVVLHAGRVFTLSVCLSVLCLRAGRVFTRIQQECSSTF
jgi:hypothetical protein